MGHIEFDGIAYTSDDDDFADVTGSEYAVGRTAEEIAATVLEADLRAEAAMEALKTVRLQAVRALRKQGLSVRDVAKRLRFGKSPVARLAAGNPFRREPQPDIDRLVMAAWDDGLRVERVRPAPRQGDKARTYNIRLNILGAENDVADPQLGR